MGRYNVENETCFNICSPKFIKINSGDYFYQQSTCGYNLLEQHDENPPIPFSKVTSALSSVAENL